LARLYSEDPSVKENGGQFSINRVEKNIDPAFLLAAFKLKEGQISGVVKSKFGLHIIQMVSRAGDDAVVRHILKIPPVTDIEIKAAVAKLDSIKLRITSGNMGFADAVNKLTEDESSKLTGGYFTGRDGSTYVSIDELDKDAALALKDLKVGEVSKPQVYADERGRKAVRLLFLKSRTEPHRENLRDDYNKIAQRSLDAKKQMVLEKWFKEHIPNYYVTIDKDYTGCDTISDWINVANLSAR
ncbi:MAG TPA: peptidylprolyl isomerase, partial [Panacibacter sp.]|nr:peptidylprolyl isomerase [Panacibacter sp.]